jgi:hypothetical protein
MMWSPGAYQIAAEGKRPKVASARGSPDLARIADEWIQLPANPWTGASGLRRLTSQKKLPVWCC